MKIIKKIFISLFICFMALCLFNVMSSNVHATDITTDAQISVLGAGVRTTGNAGIRFVGSVGTYSTDNVKAYGIAIAFGEAEANADFVVGGTVNGKSVLSTTENVTLDSNGYFYVVLYGIPEASYLQDVTARAYVVLNDNSTVYGSTVTKRNLGDVSFKAINDGYTGEILTNVLTSLTTNYMKAGTDCFNNYVISNLYENDYAKLREIFLNDYNSFAGTSLTSSSTYEAYYSAMQSSSGSSLNACVDITDSNLYKFFKDDQMSAKWMWLLDYLDTFNYTHLNNQIKAIKGDGTKEGSSCNYNLWRLIHVVETIYNFFNMGTQNGYPTKTFPNESSYSTLNNTTIFAELSNYEMISIGSSLSLPDFANKAGYTKKYVSNGTDYSIGDNVTVVNTKTIFVKTYNTISYNINYVLNEGVNPDEPLNSYTIETNTALPIPTRTDYVFLGWTEETESNDYVDSLLGKTGNLTLYAQWKYSPSANLNISGIDVTNLNAIQPSIIVNTSLLEKNYTLIGTGLDNYFETTIYYYGVNAFTNLNDAFTAAENEDEIYVFAGTYTGDATLTCSNVKVYGPNYNVLSSNTRNTEAIYSGIITLGHQANNNEIKGFKFIDGAKITSYALGDKSARTYTLTNFVLENCIIDKGTNTNSFMLLSSGNRVYSKDINIIGCSFTGSATTEPMIKMINNENVTINNCVFDNILNHAFFVDDSTNGLGLAGNLTVTSSKFTNITKSAIWIDYANPGSPNTCSVLISNNYLENVNGGAAIDIEANVDGRAYQNGFLITKNTFKNVWKCFWNNTISGIVFTKNIIYFDDLTTGYIVKGSSSYAINCAGNLYYTTDGSTIITTPYTYRSTAFNGASSSTANTDNYATKEAYEAAIAE